LSDGWKDGRKNPSCRFVDEVDRYTRMTRRRVAGGRRRSSRRRS